MNDEDLALLRKGVAHLQRELAALQDVADSVMRLVDSMTDEPLPGLRVVPPATRHALTDWKPATTTHSGYTRRQDYIEGRAEDQRDRD